jgi:hypothetical protein
MRDSQHWKSRKPPARILAGVRAWNKRPQSRTASHFSAKV